MITFFFRLKNFFGYLISSLKTMYVLYFMHLKTKLIFWIFKYNKIQSSLLTLTFI